ncbi:MAG: MFS transporter [Burkholderiaceae bacterium]|nr:MFS transporter [Burkholderiaceae bacterium]
MTNHRDWRDAVYERLAGDDDGRVCAAISDDACREAPGNFLRLGAANALTALADSVASAKTTLPWLLAQLGSPAGLTALLVPLRESGSMLPQLLLGAAVRRMPVRKHVWVACAVVQALSLAGMAAAALWLQGLTAGLAVIACLAVFSLARAGGSMSYKDVLGKTIPKTRRGRLSGWIAALAGGGALAIGVALAGLSAQAPVTLFVALLVAAAGCWGVAAAVFARIVEAPGASEGAAGGWAAVLASLRLLRDDVALRRFVAARALALGSALSAPLVVALARDAQGGGVGWLGLFIALEGVAALVSAPLWGRWADDDSPRVFTLASGAAGVLAIVAATLVGAGAPLAWQAAGLPLLFLGLGVAHAGVRLARKTYLVDIATGDRRTEYTAVSNSVIGLVLLGAGAVGALAASVSIPATLGVLGLGSLAGAALARRWAPA